MSFIKVTVIILLYFSVRAISESTKEGSSINVLIPVGCDSETLTDGILVLPSNQKSEIYVFGYNLTSNLHVGLAKYENCEYVEPSELKILEGSDGHLAVMSFITPPTGMNVLTEVRFYICIRAPGDGKWVSQHVTNVEIYVYRPLITPIIFLIIIILCFLMSSLMSGLNIGLMTLDQNELHLLKNSGTIQEKKYAKKIIPVRRNGNYLLCSILVTATLCNAIATVSIERFMSDWITVAISTVVIVLACEILPQSVCTYFPLLIGAKTVYITRACMVLTAPVSYPLSMLLNLILGKELAATYTKERLKELLKMTQLPTNEEKIICGTLDLSKKKVEQIMTMLDDVFILPITAVMDFETIALILASGYSRIPIYVGKKSNIQHVLLTKDLALLDPDDNVPVNVLVNHSNYTCRYIPEGTTLDSALNHFKDSRGHMAFIIDDAVPSDSKEKHVIGLMTFEDVIEEIFQAEINDETDTFSDNRTKRRLTGVLETNDLFSMLNRNTKTTAPSENLKLATFHFLSGIDVFSVEYISPKVLLSVLGLDIYYSTPGKKLPQDNVYIQGVPADYFVMVLEGQMEVKIGCEDLKFVAGPFRFFGVEALRRVTVSKLEPGFIPDYTLQAVTKTLYLKIPRVVYDAAILATRFERFKEIPKISKKSDLYKYFKLMVGTDVDFESIN